MNGTVYDGGAHINGIAKGDSIGVVYQKNNPENNMTVFEYFDGPEYGAVTIFVIIAIVLAVYRWLRINRKYNEQCPELERSGKCAIYRTDKGYILSRYIMSTRVIRLNSCLLTAIMGRLRIL